MNKKFDLAENVTYVRLEHDGTVQKGEGIVHGSAIGPNKRAQYIIKDGDKAYTMPPQALNCSEAEEIAYLDHARKVREVADDFNSRSQAIINEGIALVDKMSDEFFGSPLVE